MKTSQDNALEKRALVQLHHHVGGDSVQLWKYLEPYGSAHTALLKLPKQQQFNMEKQDRDRHEERTDPFALLRRAKARPLTWLDDDYPALLSRDRHWPPVLYVRGSFRPEDACAVAIVGSRRATRWARQLAYELARDLAALGITIVSGLATGIDAAAHQGALETGRTIAVTGCGIDKMYPRQHAALSDRIAANGAVISQFPCGAAPMAYHFPLRNHTIVRLVLGVIVVEAPEKSGAVLTGRIALDRNVELMVCPGDAGRPSCRGSNALLKEKGAAVVENARDVLDALRLEAPYTLNPALHGEPLIEHAPDWLGPEPASIDELIERSALTIGQLRARLTELELLGRVIRLEGDRYQLTNATKRVSG